MIPIGQLDGGHISYTIFGRKNHFKIAAVCFIILFVIGILGFVDAYMELNLNVGWSGWLIWAIILYTVIKLKHPPIPDETPLDKRRMILGYISFVIFIISFSPTPFEISGGM